ncbi:MAG: GntR family transcriptional regulator [Deltaproteobacteria bacterium]|nr:GntR family transcriptional regulator [Deltaproteobacteria bacterium]
MKQNNFSKPRSLVDQIKNDLCDAIEKGALMPGQQLKEVELQKWFGVSRAPIREALRLLQGDGLITMDDYKKRCVRRITKKDIEEIFPVMACLEGLAAGLAASKITTEQIGKLTGISLKMAAAHKEKKYKLCTRLNYEFHSIIINIVDSHALNRAMRSLTKGSIWLWITNCYYEKDDSILLSISEHNRIIKALKEKNSKKAEQEARNHINQVYQRSLEFAIFDNEGDYVLTIDSNKKEVVE